MKSTIKIITRYILSAAGVALTLLIINLLVLFIWNMHTVLISSKTTRVSQLAEGLTFQDGIYVLPEDYQESLTNKFQWAMLISEEGKVVWSYQLPDDVPQQYSLSDIASFTRWYLGDYPVSVWQRPDGLFVAGGAKNSLWKYLLEVPEYELDSILLLLPVILIVNALLAVLIAMIFGIRLSRSLKPLAQGIKDMSEKKAVKLPAKGLLGDFAADINKASAYLVKQDEALQKRDDARTKWIAGVSHDIRTPLSLVMGYANELENAPELSDTNREQARIIRVQSQRIKELVSDLNLTSKLEYDMQPLRSEMVSLGELIRIVAADFLNNLNGTDYPIEVEMKDGIQDARVQGDKQLLGRAISNLIINSIKHNPKGCHIKVTLGKYDPFYFISVADDGVGFASKICTALNQMEDPQKSSGVGLGLTIVYRIVKAHGGNIAACNLTNGGCEVKLFLPINIP
ncbi:MAG: HAMP domain-containing histidine kinase [Anaerolineae bacterium]|jgi:signal transduction histidine kinase|nr:HAMP domain-containing histidine kinase [Anaerolineae bacterium]